MTPILVMNSPTARLLTALVLSPNIHLCFYSPNYLGKMFSTKLGVSLFIRAGLMLMVTRKHHLASLFTIIKDTHFRVFLFR